MADDIFNSDDDRPHVDTNVCGKCRKEFKRGNRVGPAYIFEGKGINPLNLGNSGVHLFAEFELVHIDCNDPFLKKGLVV